jgi:hypothetical protein
MSPTSVLSIASLSPNDTPFKMKIQEEERYIGCNREGRERKMEM